MACFLVHSLAVLLNLLLSSANILATSGRVGRGEQGEASREWRESSTRLMEELGDHCDRKIDPRQANFVSNFLAEEPFFWGETFICMYRYVTGVLSGSDD